jgi:hypothetical protein
MIRPFLYLKKTSVKGRGVFTSKEIKPGMLLEESPVIVMPAKDRENIDKTLLHDYIFEWGEKNGEPMKCCMALGWAPMYNHSYQSNCEYYMDFEEELIQIKAIRKIAKDEELTINYNGDWNDDKKVWFEVR